ncbi:putative transcriptional regulatory protein [Pseudocercospora fuligena]|uniref:Putative transcriptional regulatory protein n=1 Tax=Pseudocercospora fuligena TaxID=685502 RepID=A0A8H6REN6_9PEZI|nr:putative transcriptional regulatory protein [Pseudocercospora fuligena]
MFSGATQAEPLRPFQPHHERHVSHNDRLPYMNHTPRPELPRPLEPRPNHLPQPAFNEAPASQRRPDAFRAAPAQSEFRPQSQNLPRLHDILTSAPPAPSPPAYSNGWSSTAGPTAPQQNGDSYYSHTAHHAPAAYPPQSAPSYHPQPDRRLELPILETSPVARHDSHSVVPPSPYGAHPDSAREYNGPARERPRQTSTSSYYPNGVPSPYTPAGHDEHQYRSPATSMDRPGSNSFTPAGPESSKKYLGVREVAGEGTFHFYEGGYRIPTQVEGEPVNPAWGLTKANKPRKRLAMACLDCREKKIKCEPGANSCLQCEKAKRPCRKAPIHQSQSDTSTTPIWPSTATSPIRERISDPTPANGHEPDVEAMHKRRNLEDHSPPGTVTKKHRSASPSYVTHGSVTASVGVNNYNTSPPMPRNESKGLSWEEDPYSVDPQLTLRLLEHFFEDVNDATYNMFPRHHFIHWVRTCSQKCQNERLVLYAMLAMASIFADDAYSAFGKQCANITAEALQSKHGRFSMPVVQARLLLGLYHFARGANDLTWDYIGAGMNAANFLRYHTEQGCVDDESQIERARNEFAFTKEQLIECKRRTFWSGFLMDRYCGGRSTIITSQDIFLRLPCLDDQYERGLKSEAPYYNNGIIDPVQTILTASSPVSPMSWLILVSAIWGDVVNFMYRAVHRSALVYEEEYEKFYEQACTALEGWSSRLPDQLQFSQANMERSIKGGYAGPYVSMHILYHLSLVKMNRFVRHALVPKSITRNIRATTRHSHELLQVMSTLRAAKWDMAEKDGHIASFSFTTPFAGYAILAAIDVVGAGGLDSNLKATLDLISCGLECLRELARYWNSARDQDKACEKRYYQIHNVLKHPFTARSGCWLGREWGVHSSLEREFDAENDCIYGAELDRAYFDALKDETTTNGRTPNGGLRIA